MDEIEYCGLDIELLDVEKGVPFICQCLSKLGAPKGSLFQYEFEGQNIEVPFGVTEGLGLYLNGTALPDEVYRKCNVNFVFDEVNRLLGELGAIQGHWQGPTETALYIYGNSAEEMKQRISSFIAEYPLCQKARLVVIA